MPTTVVLIRGGPNPDAGKRLIDSLLSAETEQRMAEAAPHMPLRQGVPTPAGVKPLSEIRPMEIDYARVAAQMKEIQPRLRQWAGL
jgi:iron(III) transport system substrate-binding protein